jgi:hypothetical protein
LEAADDEEEESEEAPPEQPRPNGANGEWMDEQ